jgi:hypothetical protein
MPRRLNIHLAIRGARDRFLEGEKYTMKLMRSFFVLFLILLSGCAADPARIPDLSGPSAGKAVIYIYRTDASADTDAYAPNVRVNNRSIGSLLRRGYFRVEVDPGTTQVALHAVDRGDENTYWPASRSAIVDLAATAGSTYFVELSLNTMIFKFGPATRERALEGMSALYLLN